MNENVQMNPNPENISDQIHRDASLDLKALMENAQVEEVKSETPAEKKTPLQEMIENGGPQKGISVTRKELEDGAAMQPLRSNNETEEFQKGVHTELQELDTMIAAAKNAQGLKKPANVQEHLAMIDGLAGHNYKDEIRESIMLKKRDEAISSGKSAKDVVVTEEEVEAEYQKWLTSIEGQRAQQVSAAVNHEPVQAESAPAPVAPATSTSTEINTEEETSDEEVQGPKENKDPEAQQIVNILIDKTGFGADVVLSDVEKEQIEVADKVVVTEIESIDLESIAIEDTDKSFLELARDFKMDKLCTPVMFPFSMFRASMEGLTYGDLTTFLFTGDKDVSEFEKMNIRLPIIYNKLSNISVGAFPSYDEFLANFFVQDMEMAVFGLACSTLPEQDTLQVNCPKCGSTFEVAYAPRTLLDFKLMDTSILKRFDSLMEATDAFTARKLFEDNKKDRVHRIKLPDSGTIMDLGLPTAAELISNQTAQIFSDPESFADKIGPKAVSYIQYLGFVNAIKSVATPRNGKYYRFKSVDDILEVLYNLNTRDTKILAAYLNRMSAPIETIYFSVRNARCPHCGMVHERLFADINSLVFQRAQAIVSTKVELSDTLQ